MSASVFCIAPSDVVANAIVFRLKNAEFRDNDISVLFPDKSTTRDFAHEKNTKAPEGAVAGAGAGGVIGGTLGLLAGIGLLAIPGLGPFIAAGPIMASLGGIAAGATLGGISGALIGMGIPELEAKRFEGKLKDGNILIAVHAEDSKREKAAKEIFESEHATDISVGSAKSTHDDSKKHAHSPETHHDRRDTVRADARLGVDRGAAYPDTKLAGQHLAGGNDPGRRPDTAR